MIEKQKLTSIISKYNLMNRNESVKWFFKDNTLTIYFGEPGRVGKVILKDIEFEECTLAVFNTNQLSKLISVTQGMVLLETEQQNKVYTKLLLSDANFNLTYSLSDIMMIPKVSWVTNENDFEYEVELSLDEEQVTNLVKAKNALLESQTMLINTDKDLDGNPVVDFIFGDNTGFSNKISYQVRGRVDIQNLSIPFDAMLFRDILKVNQDAKTSKLSLNKQGVLKLEFDNDLTSGVYYMARNE